MDRKGSQFQLVVDFFADLVDDSVDLLYAFTLLGQAALVFVDVADLGED